MKIKGKLILGATLVGFFAVNVADIKASAYHTGTPKALRGCWYLGKKSYLEYWAHHTGTSSLKYSPTYLGYFKAKPYGLTYVKYKYLGSHIYRISGWNYSTDQNFREVLPTNQRYTYDVQLLDSSHLYLLDRNITYRKYMYTPSWIIE